MFEEPEDPSNRSFFSEIISSISDVKFSHSGRYMMTRDYLSVKIWDLNMENRPVETYQVWAENEKPGQGLSLTDGFDVAVAVLSVNSGSASLRFGDSTILLEHLGICGVLAEPKPMFGAEKASLLLRGNLGGGEAISSHENHDKSGSLYVLIFPEKNRRRNISFSQNAFSYL